MLENTFAEDAIACELGARHDQTLRFHVDAVDLSPGAYRATVWGSHSGDEVIRREIAVTRGLTVIKLASDVDHVGFAIYRTVDGQCVDLMEAFLIMEIGGRMEVASSPTLHLRDRRRRLSHKVTPAGSTSMISIRSDDDSAEAVDERPEPAAVTSAPVATAPAPIPTTTIGTVQTLPPPPTTTAAQQVVTATTAADSDGEAEQRLVLSVVGIGYDSTLNVREEPGGQIVAKLDSTGTGIVPTGTRQEVSGVLWHEVHAAASGCACSRPATATERSRCATSRAP